MTLFQPSSKHLYCFSGIRVSMKKDTLLVLAIILIPIVILGAIAVNGASNLPEEHGEGNETTEETNTTATAEMVAPLHLVMHETQIVEPMQILT